MLSRVAAPPSSRATRRVARNEARKRRASERRYVGSCNELAGQDGPTRSARCDRLLATTDPKTHDDAHYNGQHWRGKELRAAKKTDRDTRLADDLVNQHAEETV